MVDETVVLIVVFNVSCGEAVKCIPVEVVVVVLQM